ncbi:MAG TPA: hypothetical protein VHX65_19820 [Pirellulales bacterium]|jgi:hypothetical protein|nr:hypothetical protein [Pirellulales bacterium]
MGATQEQLATVESLRKFTSDVETAAASLDQWMVDAEVNRVALERAIARHNTVIETAFRQKANLLRIGVACRGKLARADEAIAALERGF